jgi:preprotein translocase subunit SecY
MNWKTVFRSLKNRDMQKRLGIVFGLIVVYRFLAHVPAPIADPSTIRDVVENLLNSTDFGGFLNLLSGGTFSGPDIARMINMCDLEQLFIRVS